MENKGRDEGGKEKSIFGRERHGGKRRENSRWWRRKTKWSSGGEAR